MKKSIETICVHAGTIIDKTTLGTRTPLYPSNSHLHLDLKEDIYPRHSNLQNQRAVSAKLSTLEQGGMTLMFSSGMAAISTALLTHLSPGDHLVVQLGVYSGTTNFVRRHLAKQGIEVSFTTGTAHTDFLNLLRPNTRIIYMESPTNPLLDIVDIELIAAIAAENDILTFIDNTIATPINQNPLTIGVDIVLHSASKYLGGHGDITAGAAIGSDKMITPMLEYINDYGGCLNPQACHLLERSLLTLSLRIERSNDNALRLAKLLSCHPSVSRVLYPGLEDHPRHQTAKKQMTGFGAVLTFELKEHLNLQTFQRALRLIIPANSMGEVATTLNSPFEASTSFKNLTDEERDVIGVSSRMIRMSVGIESVTELYADLNQALTKETN